jgi:hypothetical protein
MDSEQSNYQKNKPYILKSRQKNKDSYNTYQREYYYKKQGFTEEEIEEKNQKRLESIKKQAASFGYKLVKI